MRLLLDTSTFIWLLDAPENLSQTARKEFLQAEATYVSHVSLWEIIMKHDAGKFALNTEPGPFFSAACAEHGINLLPFDIESVYRVSALPRIHKDPFDRLLISQALIKNLTIMTKDRMIRQYPVPTLW